MTGPHADDESKPHCAQVEAMAGYGVTPADIAQVLGIDIETLKADYASQLDGGHIKANARVAENLYRKATGEGREAVTAAIFWLKTRARWKETSVQEHVGDPYSPIVFHTIYETIPPKDQ
ncbi:hypothetical protein [Mesorhizobium sp. STM 4661]|uniref:hypothetical protein n=1 Tax=Mesorhizobium sp. STM 4661 TaxID=1297570 RepID=UPI0002BFC194|nr:hypothetical protein [Mesorhizobium sp. STM 4661]CCV15446.1 hypothetical protein MESS4_790009 [Mesorhizobium sp. STM 4661]